MEIQKSTGIVLSARVIGEADYLIRIFTKEYGKRDFVFKGLRKSKRRSHTIAEPGTIAGIVYYFNEEKGLHTVNEYEIYKHYLRIRDDFKKILLLYYFIETVEKTSGFNDVNIKVFDLLAAGIDALSETKNALHLAVFFTIHLIRLHGILPDFSRCKVCKRDDFPEFIIDVVDFHPVCRGCSARYNAPLFLKSGAREFLHESLRKKYSDITLSMFSGKDISDLFFSLCLFIQAYFHIQLKSKDMLIPEFKKSL